MTDERKQKLAAIAEKKIATLKANRKEKADKRSVRLLKHLLLVAYAKGGTVERNGVTRSAREIIRERLYV